MYPGKRIALVCNSSWAMVNFRMAVMRALRADGHELVVVAPDDGARETLAAEGIGFEAWEVRARGTNPLKELGSLTSLRAILDRLNPDLALCYTIKPAIYGSFAGAFRKRRTLAIITGLGYAFLASGWKSAIARLLYRAALRLAQDIWFLNEDDRALFRERGLIGREDGFLLPGEGVDTARFSYTSPRAVDGKTVFLMISRLFRDKGVGEYLDAAGSVKAERSDAVFRLAGPPGDGGPGTIALGDIHALEAKGVLEYLGRLEDIRPAIAEADFVVLPSYREGLPRSLLEAASMGRPLLATDVPGCREIAVDGVNAFLVAPRDAASLAEGFRRVLSLPRAEAHSMGLKGRDMVVSKFGDDAIIAAYRRRIAGA
jgi:glycosyltransferase involved in cell wall biosynthesis